MIANTGVVVAVGVILVVRTALTNNPQAFVSTFNAPALKFHEYAGMKLT